MTSAGSIEFWTKTVNHLFVLTQLSLTQVMLSLLVVSLTPKYTTVFITPQQTAFIFGKPTDIIKQIDRQPLSYFS